MRLVLAAVLATVCLGYPVVEAQEAPMRPAAPPADQKELARENNAFAVDLYGRLRSQPGNLFFSPESISTAFAMAYAGARGETAAETRQVFHYTLPPDRLDAAMGGLLAARNAPHPAYELREADALWAQQGSSLLPDYVKRMQDDYAGGLRRVDFEHAAEQARGTINEWVAQETHNRIENLIGPGVLTAQTRLVLTNAIYFKGSWLHPFEASATRDEDFYGSGGQPVKRPLMHGTGEYDYYDGGAFQELQIPYKGGDLAMVVLLPKEKDGLAALENKFTAAAADEWLGKMEFEDKVVLTLPRFTMTQELELSRTLAAMGMPQAFSAAADFSGITGKPEFSISAAIHKAYVAVNEQGTEAAAATSTVMMATAMRGPEAPPVVFRADHPFLFLIRDHRTGEILFLGRVEDPGE